MLIDKEVETKWSNWNKDWYILKGYAFTKMKSKLMVNVKDLTLGSHVIVDVLCDYCKINITSKEYRDTLKGKENVDKDCCKECKSIKNIEVWNILYANKEFNDNKQIKRKATSLVKYGYESASQSQEVKDSCKATNLIKYGFESHNSSPEVKLKKKKFS